MIEQKMGDIRSDPIKEEKYVEYEMRMQVVRDETSVSDAYKFVNNLMESTGWSFEQTTQALKLSTDMIDIVKAMFQSED